MEVNGDGRRCDAVVFDNDGLLLDTEASWTRAEEALFERRGLEFTIEHKRELLGSAPRPGALELIAALREVGIPMALASNSPRMLVDRALTTGGIDPATFVTMLTADDVSNPKPAPEIYLAAVAALGTQPERTLVLEDSPTGVTAAVAAGCYTIAVPSLDGVDLGAAELIVDSLAAVEIMQALGL